MQQIPRTAGGAAAHPRGIFIRWDAELPKVCLMCGTKKRLQRYERLGTDDIHPIVGGNPVAMLSGFVMVLVVRYVRSHRKQADLAHWRCAACDARLREAENIRPIWLIAPFIAVLFGIISGFATTPIWGWLTAAIVGVGTGLVGWVSRPRVLRVESVEPHGIVVSGMTAKSADALLTSRIAGS
ncbi:hypothetical protein [Pendulispora albinea]|uniref:Uncharacterized protein n=1 Tax=Pendulispora albinea TaxID=2741071 RepID=A0ABZ2LZE7_9BACT